MTFPEQPQPYPGDVALAAVPTEDVATVRPEQPAAYPGDALHGAVPVYRVYRDALGRPLSGRVTITGTVRTVDGDQVIPAAPVDVLVEHGVLSVNLLPDTYQFAAELRTADGRRTTDVDNVTVSA